MMTTTMMWRTKALSSHPKGRRQKSPAKEKNKPNKRNKDPLQCFFFPLRSFSIRQPNSSPTWKTPRLSDISIKNSPPCQWHLPYHILSLMSCVRFNGNQQPRPQCPCTSCFSGSAVACAGCLLAIRDLIWSTVCFEYQMFYPMLRFI